MDSFELKDFNKRIKLNTDLKNISKVICDKYELGDFASNELIEIGYEDYNYYLTTSKGKYCVKIFSKIRTNEDIKNYLNRIRAVAKSEISSPKPLLLNDDIVFELDYENNHYDICVFEYIDGKNYFEINEKPDNDVLREIAKQTALINNLDIKPEFIYDTWAIVNFKKEYEKKRQYLSDEYKTEFDKLLNEFENIDLERLPKAFVHGDIISTNVMLDKNKKVWIIDFAVSNYLPRIIDLAVTSCNMCLQEDSKEKTYENIEVLLQEYNKYNKLTDYELEMFEVYFRLANAMHILQPNYIIQTDGDSEENQYWLNEGITGYSYSDKEEFNKIMKKLK